VQRLRRDAGLEVTDRIVLTIAKDDEGLLEHRDWIAGETLAEDVQVGDELAVRKAG
jgi:hypothetical protein